MLDVIFTSDYEIHGNGRGSPRELMVEPTSRMLRQFDRHGAKLTVMADVAEILRFRRHAAETGRDDFSYRLIEDQLVGAVRGGHDVQLHFHPAYFNAQPVDGHWKLDYDEYDFARLSTERLDAIVRAGKTYLEQLLRPVDADYECIASRAANWSMQPSERVVAALVRNGVRIDTSVFKYGRRSGLVEFDYRSAHSALVPWRAASSDVCRADPSGQLLEFPIYSENRRAHRFLSLNRIYRALETRRHPVPDDLAAASQGDGRTRSVPAQARRALALAGGRHAWKLDFNQCSRRQLVAGLERAARTYDEPGRTLPVVLIGHSKLFTRFNERQLEPVLNHIAQRPDRYRFSTFPESVERVSCTKG